jgi:glycosyltransferase involved in cell wall biosynthesis
MRICLVTSFPPSHERLNEYGFHLATELQRDPCLDLTVLADEFGGTDELPEFNIVRCWKPDDPSTPLRLMKKFRDLRPDVVWFNTVFSSFGATPAPAFLGLCTPALARASGFSTHVTLHHLMESLDLASVGIRHAAMYRLGGAFATRLLLLANSVTVLLPAYRRTLIQKYRGKNVHLRAHGIFAGSPQYPDFSRRGNPEHRILAFGKWGTYKRLDILLDAFVRVAREVPDARLVIAGENHPSTPGYVEGIAERVKDNPQITVRGYVAEKDIADLFSTASLAVMPYNSATGSSGVAHQACQFGVPILCADIPEFRDMAQEERIAMQFYRRGDRDSLTDALVSLLQDSDLQRDMAEQNFHAAMRMTMPQIVRQYLRAFDWHRRPRMSSLSRRLGRVRPAWGAYPTGASTPPASPSLVPIVTRNADGTDLPMTA